jgi:hypothetical protein
VTSRHDAIDALRGLLLILMALNHVSIPAALYVALHFPLGVMTAAEGFVIIAGLVIGLVYTRKLQRDGFAAITRQLVRRAGTIYLAHLACFAGVFCWMAVYAIFFNDGRPPVGSPWALFEQPAAAWGATLLLLFRPGLLDVLPLYCGLVLVTPLALHQLARGRAAGVLLVSAALWVVTNLIDEPRPLVRGLINTGAFNFGAWQFIYLSALVAGHTWVEGRWPAWLRPSRRLLMLCGGGLLTFTLAHNCFADGSPYSETWFRLTNKNNAGPLRLLNVGIAALSIFAWLGLRAQTRTPASSRSPSRFVALLTLLGRNSLPVFSAHVVVAMIILGLPWWFEWVTWGRWIGPVLLLTAMFATAFGVERFACRSSTPPASPTPLSP